MSSRTTDYRQKRFLPAAGHDLFLPLYDPVMRLLGGDRTRRELIDQANLKAGQRVLDIGCGTGTFVVLLKQQHESVQVVGLDPDPKALRRARDKGRRAAVSVQFDQGFADEMSYEGGSFDRVFSSLMFHHLEGETREQTLKEVVRVLKPGGSFHLVDFTGDEHKSPGFLDRLIHSHHQVKDNTEEGLLQLMRRAGFAKAAKVKDGSMLLGLLRTVYYEATA